MCNGERILGSCDAPGSTFFEVCETGYSNRTFCLTHGGEAVLQCSGMGEMNIMGCSEGGQNVECAANGSKYN